MILPKTKLTASYFSLFRYATCLEKLLIFVGLLMAVLSSFGLLAAIVIYGELTTLFVDRTVRNGTSTQIIILQWFGGGQILTTGTDEDFQSALIADSEAYGLASICTVGVHFITALLSVQLLNWTAVRQISRIRLLFLRSVIRQDMAWYDTETNLNFASRITDDLEKLKEGIAEKVAMFMYLVGTVVVCCGFALAYGWELTLVGLTIVPLSIGAAAIVLRIQAKSTDRELEAYSHAGRVVEEVLSGIRTVVAYNGEEKEIERYSKRLAPAETCGRRRGAITGLGAGFNWFLTYLLNSIIFLYGTHLIVRDSGLPPEEKSYYPGTMVTILFCIFCAAQNIALCSPHTETFSAAKGAARAIYQLLDRRPEIDCLSTAGLKPSGGLVGSIKLDNVFFNYPSRPDVKVLRGLTLEIKPGETVALVGSSGCGKSTILQLVQRLYDPASGSVSIDGNPIKNLNTSWLRNHLGVVGQEPVLFSGTIRENIALGKEHSTYDEVKEAAKKAFAHDFIKNLTDGYDTMIGERGAQLSGGQKQRIAIARSLIRDPKILLLDEATSALDLRSEKTVQVALDKASEGRTTLVVSHRLSTVVNASRIVFIDKGVVVEQGTHKELLAKQGMYWQLVQADQDHQKHTPTTIDTLKEEAGNEEDADDGQALDDEAGKSTGFSGPSRHSNRPTSFVRDSVSPERPPTYSSLRMVQRKSSISSVKSTGMVQVNPAMYEDDTPEDKQDMDAQVSAWELMKLNKKEWPYIVIGCIASCFIGCTLPLFAVLFSEVYGMFSYGDNDQIIAASQLYAGLFALVAFLCGLATFTQTHVFTIAGLKLTTRLRIQTFQSFLKQDIGWFDDQKNSVGALCARLSTDAAAVQGATGMRVGTILQGVATMVIGIVIAMVYSWKMTLVSLVTIPLVIGGIYLEGALMKASQITERQAMENASKIATEAIMNVRTVQSMGVERNFLAKYTVALDEAGRASSIRTRLRGCVYALGLTAPTLGYAISLYYGGLLIAKENMPYKTAILVSETLIYGSWMLGQALSFAPNFSAAKVSGSRIVKLIGREPQIKDAEDIKDDPGWVAKGDISYNSVHFRYPTRRNVEVLRGLNLKMMAGKTMALVGHSGSGKSTCLQLLQRQYDADSGTLTIDNKDITKELKLRRLRAQLGIVQQEPVLFDKTIAENIMYGDNSREVSMDEVVKATKAANIHNFVTGLPMGYETNLGSKGAQLSGGQKQRLAIARALVRNPRILLLDEATSALDTQSEKLVQQALDIAKEGRTCIIIAHRLATIVNADCICVLDKGQVAERGTHTELMQRRGLYYELHSLQPDSTSGIAPVYPI